MSSSLEKVLDLAQPLAVIIGVIVSACSAWLTYRTYRSEVNRQKNEARERNQKALEDLLIRFDGTEHLGRPKGDDLTLQLMYSALISEINLRVSKDFAGIARRVLWNDGPEAGARGEIRESILMKIEKASLK